MPVTLNNEQKHKMQKRKPVLSAQGELSRIKAQVSAEHVQRGHIQMLLARNLLLIANNALLGPISPYRQQHPAACALLVALDSIQAKKDLHTACQSSLASLLHPLQARIIRSAHLARMHHCFSPVTHANHVVPVSSLG
jgi:hypothetical protein